MTYAAYRIKEGSRHPFNDRLPEDAAHRAALGVLAELRGTFELKEALDAMDNAARSYLIDNLIDIIKEAGLTAN